MKFIKIVIMFFIWLAMLSPMLYVMGEQHGWMFAASVYSYILLTIFAIATIGTFDDWFKSKLKEQNDGTESK